MVIHHHELTLVSAYVDQALDVEEILLMEEHLRTCASCQREVTLIREMKTAFAQLPRHHVSAALWDKLESNVRTAPWFIRWGLSLAAPRVWVPAGVLAGLAAVMLWQNWPSTTDQNTMALEPLLAAHDRYASDSSFATSDYFNSNFSAQLAAYREGDR